MPSLWGARLASLQKLDYGPGPGQDMLARDSLGAGAGSWLDPLFEGPAPLRELQGLGDRYRDLTFLGQGSAARVFKAMDTLLLRQVALKVLKDESAATLVEARAQAQIEHPNVCRIYEVGQGHIVLQLVEGPSLASLAPSLSQAQKVRIIRDVARGVHAAHRKGLLHLDLKLDNILMQEDTLDPMVSDFGMVRSSGSGPGGPCPLGTPPYTSPEQLAGDPARLGPGADIYAMGVMLYVLLAGANPFMAPDFPRLLEAMAKDPPVPLRKRIPAAPRDLERLVHRCMEKDPASRYASAEDLAEDLDRFLRDEPVLAMGPARGYRLRKWFRRNRRLTRLAVVGLAALLLVSGFFVRKIVLINQQAGWDYHFQKEVEEMRTYLDRAYRLPEHDVEPELRHARERIRALEEEVASQGKIAAGPGHLALGQALLLMDPNDATAGEHFQRAWNLGLRTEGARIWLAFSLVKDFEKADMEFRGEPNREEASRTLLKKRFLEPAWRLLSGRSSPDQARLAHLAQVVALQSREEGNQEALLALARNHRARFPDDVDALLEEAMALETKASSLGFHASGTPIAWPLPNGAEITSLRQASVEVLLRAHQIAPSHPRVHDLLGWSFAIWAESADRQEIARQRLLDQAKDWLARGLRISGMDPQLTQSNLDLASGALLEDRLRQGLDPGPQVQAFRLLLERCWASPDDRIFSQALPASLDFVNTFGKFGIRQSGPLLEALEHVEKRLAAGSSCGAISPYTLLEAATYMVEAGLDPDPWFHLAPRVARFQEQAPDWYGTFRLHFLEAHYRLQVGGDALAPLREAERLHQANRTRDAYRAKIGTRALAFLKASLLDDAPSWSALEEALAGDEILKGADVPLRIKATVALLQHQFETGREIGPAVGALRKTLEGELLRPTMVQEDLLRESLAEIALLQARIEARAGKDPARTLRAGLSQAARALEYRPVRPYPSMIQMKWGGAPHQGRTWAIQGKLLLALAERSSAPGPRSRQAEAAIRTALHYNPHLEHGLAKDLARARALARGWPASRSMPPSPTPIGSSHAPK